MVSKSIINNKANSHL